MDVSSVQDKVVVVSVGDFVFSGIPVVDVVFLDNFFATARRIHIHDQLLFCVQTTLFFLIKQNIDPIRPKLIPK